MTFRSIVVGLALCAAGSTHAQHPVVQAVLDSVRIDSMTLYLNELTGEVPIDLGGGPQTIVSRHKNNAGNDLARLWLEHKLTQFGYTVQQQSWSSTGRNIVVTKPGTVAAAWPVVLGAHYDAMPAGNLAAPGADDNGSGTVALLEAARVLRNVQFEHPIIFAFWDEEEQGLVGSEHHAAELASNDVLLRAVINMDAIGYDGNGDKRMRVHVRPVGNSFEIGDTLVAVRGHYGLDLDLVVTNPGATYSDHASFWNEGYGAALVIEDFGPDSNPDYHLPTDRVENLDLPYYEKLVKLAIAGTATFAVPVDDVVQGVNTSVQVPFRAAAYPNPTDDRCTFWVETPSAGPFRIVLHDALGQVVAVMHEGLLPAGKQAFSLSLSAQAPGTYAIVVGRAGQAPVVVRVLRTP